MSHSEKGHQGDKAGADTISVHSADNEHGADKENNKGQKGNKGRDPAVPVKLDMEQRDPNDLNTFIETQFDDVIGEPEGAHSDDCVWINAFKCFTIGNEGCYKISTFICSIPLGFIWGCQFACVTFCHIWCVTPCFRLFNLNFECFRRFWSLCVHCMYDPCFEAASLTFSRVGVRYRENGSSGTQTPTGSEGPARFKKDYYGKKQWD